MKTVDEIYQELLAAFAQRAGYAPNDGCDLAVRLYAAAAQLQALQVQSDWVLNQSFPQTAQGSYLDDHAAIRGLSRVAAGKATGKIRFSVETAPVVNLTIETGTVCMTAGETRFITTAPAIIPTGGLYADAPAEAVEAGVSGNVLAGTVTVLAACPTGVTACTNPAAFTGGADIEDDESLRARILDSYRRLPNGANAAYYEEVALSHDGVVAAKAVGRPRGVGTVDVYITTAAGVPDKALLEEVLADLQAKREIAVDVQVLSPTRQGVNVAVAVTPDGGTDFAAVKPKVEAAIRGFFTGELLGQSLRLAELGERIYHVDGVANYHLTAPTADVAAGEGVLPALGGLQITELKEA